IDGPCREAGAVLGPGPPPADQPAARRLAAEWGATMTRASIARATASARLDAPSFAKASPRCQLTVRWLMPRADAISFVVRPRATQRRIVSSRGDNAATSRLGGGIGPSYRSVRAPAI